MKKALILTLTLAFASVTFASAQCGGCKGSDKEKDKTEETTAKK